MSKKFDLEDRTLDFSKSVIGLCRKLNRDTVNIQLISQLVRSSGSVGANYREANEALGKKDFAYRMRISRKEAKETSYWLELLLEANANFGNDIKPLLQEAKEIRSIFTAIIEKTKK